MQFIRSEVRLSDDMVPTFFQKDEMSDDVYFIFGLSETAQRLTNYEISAEIKMYIPVAQMQMMVELFQRYENEIDEVTLGSSELDEMLELTK